MATIEERAQKWAHDYWSTAHERAESVITMMIAAYLAGSAQTQKDYANADGK